MFSSQYKETENLVPQIYFGGEEPPPYLTASITDGATIVETAEDILLIGGGAQSCGYIENGRIFFHLCEGGEFHIDLSKEFIYLAAHESPGHVLPTAFMTLRFLQEPCRRALFITSREAVYLEKTADSYQLCNELDAIWGIWVGLCGKKQISRKSQHCRILPCLMKYYEEVVVGVSSEEWEFWDAFCYDLLQKRLKLKVEATPLRS